ncbi:methionine ABC transporter ATP-binding protein [Sulfurospirillum diekertiae]|uniref:Cell division ATP-binding protein FtsE n=1 Tax=Sulfurospirillum diekertiae TaxID=1854492 RepID=A0A1Y0HK04_9BACT|nr:ATP-binding cassette domain-containing protein [Sulfurospirillum diekertiae]ARU47573.1 Methionine import ATP-binding protein MetN [Sulfurospirillum diekertiae]ASC92421.1 Methionine import ATP-binding protein MetN [Sulfurospirillum diekertiae]
MVNIENVTVTFQTKDTSFKAVDTINLHIQEGEIFGIVGTSGAGKSTLIRTINLLQKPTSGKIWIAGEDITEYTGLKLRTIRHSIGMIFQHFNLIHTKTVFDNVAFPMVIAGASKEAIAQRVPALLELVGLSDKMHVYPSTLSGGQKQRVGIARALANSPRILLCDEPTSALDLETTNAILDLLKEINKKLGITTILITHEMDVIKKICNKVAVMDKGIVVETGSVYDIFSLPKHLFTQKLVAHTLNLELPSRILQDVQGRLIKVVYNGDRAEEPILSDAIRTFGVDINVLHGKIEYIDEKPLGVLLLNINASSAQIEQIISYLKERTASVEVFHG